MKTRILGHITYNSSHSDAENKCGFVCMRSLSKMACKSKCRYCQKAFQNALEACSGGPTALALKDEQEIVLTCQVLAEMGFGLTRQVVERVVRDYIQENGITTPFPDSVPGTDWWHCFKKQWPCLTDAGAVHGVSESGWIDACNFLSWILKLVCLAVSHLASTGPVFLFMDGHHSHISLPLIRAVRENNVQLFCLPQNCTHVLQPLDVGVFAPLKRTHILKK